jgi:hypothetical protein
MASMDQGPGIREGGERRKKTREGGRENSILVLRQPALEGNHGMQEPLCECFLQNPSYGVYIV